MRDDAIKKVFDKFEEAIGLGEGVSMDYYLKSIGYSMEEAAQQLRQYVLDEIIGEDDKPLEYPMGKITDINGEQKQLIRQRSFDGDDARNELRAEQRRKLT